LQPCHCCFEILYGVKAIDRPEPLVDALERAGGQDQPADALPCQASHNQMVRLFATLRPNLVDTDQDALVRVCSRFLRIKAEVVVIVVHAVVFRIGDGDDAGAVGLSRRTEHPVHTHARIIAFHHSLSSMTKNLITLTLICGWLISPLIGVSSCLGQWPCGSPPL